MDYTSVTLIQQKIGRALTADEASFASAVVIPAISQWLEEYTGVAFDDANGALVTYAKGGSAAVYVGHFKTLTKVEYVDAEGNADELDANAFYYERPYIFTYTGKPFNKGVRNIKATGTKMSVPAVITLAATTMAAKPLVYKGDKDVASEKIGDYQVNYTSLTQQNGVAGLFDDSIAALLAPYKVIRLA